MNETTNRQGLANLVLAQGISVTGDAVLITAASIAVFKETGSATAVSLLLGLAALPTVLFGPIAGTFADWFPRRRILMGTDILSAFACLAALLISRAVPTEVAAFVSIAAVSSLSAFYRPAAQALLPSLASAGQLGRANSALRLATSLAAIAGPAMAAFLIGRGGLSLVLAVDAGSFLISGGLVALIQRIPRQAAPLVRKSALRDAWDGLEYARRNPRIRVVTLAIGVVMLVGTLVNAGTLPLVSRSLDLPDSRYGTLLAIEGAGAMGLAVVFLVAGPGPRLLVTGSFALIGAGATTFGLSAASSFWFASAAILGQGASIVAFQVAFASYLQNEASDAFRGRVMSLVSMVASLAQLAGFAVAGPLIEWLGVRSAFMLAGGVICAVSLPVISLAFAAARQERPAHSAN